MSCFSCMHAEEYEEEINCETWLLRQCGLSGNHVDDDYTCPHDTTSKEVIFSQKMQNIKEQLNQAYDIASKMGNSQMADRIASAIAALDSSDEKSNTD